MTQNLITEFINQYMKRTGKSECTIRRYENSNDKDNVLYILDKNRQLRIRWKRTSSVVVVCKNNDGSFPEPHIYGDNYNDKSGTVHKISDSNDIENILGEILQ